MTGQASSPISVNLLVKTCSTCGETLHISRFYPKKPSGYRSVCKSCGNTAAVEWQRENPEKARLATNEWRARDPEHARELDRKNYHKDPQRAVQRVLEYQKRNRKMLTDKTNDWYKTPAGKLCASVQHHRRRARLANAYCPDADDRVRELRGSPQQCYICGKWVSEEEVTIDHVVPLARGGKHEASNLMPSCSFCNTSKGARKLEEVLR